MPTAQAGITPLQDRRRWLRFSLRGLFVVVTVLCVWFGYETTRARKQSAAVTKLKKLGVFIRFDYDYDPNGVQIPNAEPWASVWLRETLGEEYFRSVVTVDATFPSFEKAERRTRAALEEIGNLTDLTALEVGGNSFVTDDGLVHLANLKKLRTLYLYRTEIAGPGLLHLSRMKYLRALFLQNTPMTDAGLAHLQSNTGLTWLQLNGTKITDKGLPNLSRLISLEMLNLSNTAITDAGLEKLRTLAGLKQLSLAGTKVTGKGVALLQKSLPNCEILPAPGIVDAVPKDVELWAVDHKPTHEELLARVTQLGGSVQVDQTRPDPPITSLMLMDSDISDASLLRLLAEMPELEQLNLRHVLVGDQLAKGLSLCPKLSFLSMSVSRITDAGLEQVGQLANLRELDVHETQVTDNGLTHLTGLSKLEAVHVQGTRVTNAGVEELKKALPKLRVSW